jgi:hypothetical protein
MAAAEKVGSPQRIYGLQVAAAAPQFTYLFSSPFSTFEEMGGWSSIPEMLMKAHGDVEGATILKAGRATFETSETRVTRTMTEPSTNMKPYDPPSAPFIRLVRTEVDPAMTGAYEGYLAKLRAAQEKAKGYPPTTRRVSALGKAAVYSSATYLKTAADLDRLPDPIEVMREAYGEEGAKTLIDAGTRAVRSREIWLLRYRAPLSFFRFVSGAASAAIRSVLVQQVYLTVVLTEAEPRFGPAVIEAVFLIVPGTRGAVTSIWMVTGAPTGTVKLKQRMTPNMPRQFKLLMKR